MRRSKLCLLVWALTLQSVPLYAQEEDHSNDDITDPKAGIKLVRPFPCIFSPPVPLSLHSTAQVLDPHPKFNNANKQTTNFHCVNIYKLDPILNPSQTPTRLCPDDPPFPSYNYDIWLSCGFPHDGPERTSPTQYLRATWLSHVVLPWESDSAMLDERYAIIQTTLLALQPSRTRSAIQRVCNPRKEIELNPYWADFQKGAGRRDLLTWGEGGLVYDKGIKNSLCDKDDEKEKDGPFNTDGFTKESKSTTTDGGGGREGWDDDIKGLTTSPTSNSFLLPVAETSLVSVDDDGTTTTPPPLSSTSPDDHNGKAIDTFVIPAAPSSPSVVALYNNVNNNYIIDQATTRSDTKKLLIRRRIRQRAVAVG